MKMRSPEIMCIFLSVFFWGAMSGFPALAQFGDGFGTSGGRSSGLEQGEYEYPQAWKFPKNRWPQVQAEERVRALKRFSLELYQILALEESRKDQNIVCSPWSIAMLLTMLHDGANADTAKEIRKTIRFQGQSKLFEKYLHMAAFNVRAERRHEFIKAPLIFESANSFWRQEGYAFIDEYEELLTNRFRTSCFDIDFGKPGEAVKQINKWCAENTRNEIKEILTARHIRPESRMFLLNAVYFKARWQSVFSVSGTRPEWFRHADGSISKTMMMNLEEYVSYVEGYHFKALRKNYCGNAHVLLIVPDEVDGLPQVEEMLSPKILSQIDGKLKTELVKIKLPRFSFENEIDLIPVSRQLGIESAFDTDKADFSKMTEEKGFFIDFFRQKAIIKLDEEGTVASAVTGGMGAGGGPPKIYTFHADRPFLFLICESTNNGILFMGRVHHPEKVGE